MRYNDYPIEECLEVAVPYMERGAQVFQKWTCSHCHSRQTMGVANTFFRAGVCEECHMTTVISKCNYLLVMPGCYNK